MKCYEAINGIVNRTIIGLIVRLMYYLKIVLWQLITLLMLKQYINRFRLSFFYNRRSVGLIPISLAFCWMTCQNGNRNSSKHDVHKFWADPYFFGKDWGFIMDFPKMALLAKLCLELNLRPAKHYTFQKWYFKFHWYYSYVMVYSFHRYPN